MLCRRRLVRGDRDGVRVRVVVPRQGRVLLPAVPLGTMHGLAPARQLLIHSHIHFHIRSHAPCVLLTQRLRTAASHLCVLLLRGVPRGAPATGPDDGALGARAHRDVEGVVRGLGRGESVASAALEEQVRVCCA